jgi:predicted nucleic acid-binding protein
MRIPGETAEQMIDDMGVWSIHRPSHSDLILAARLQRRYQISWWNALIVQSANEMGCAVLWTDDLTHGQKYGSVTARDPFR